MYYGLGEPAEATRQVFMSCPPCSYLVEGSCVVCGAADQHPACQYCVAGIYQPPKAAWYKSEILLAVATATVVSVVSALLVTHLNRLMEARKKRAAPAA